MKTVNTILNKINAFVEDIKKEGILEQLQQELTIGFAALANELHKSMTPQPTTPSQNENPCTTQRMGACAELHVRLSVDPIQIHLS